MTLLVGSLCSGYGGLDDSVAAVLGGRTAWHAEIDPAASEVLEAAHPGAPNLGDLATLTPTQAVDALAMGVPCQPASAAGKQLAEADPRWLWPHARRILRALRPPLLVFENVEGLVTMRGGEVWRAILADMRTAGYAVRWLVMGACVVGAPHHRHRVFALAAYVGADAPPAVRLAVPKCGVGRNGALLLTPRACDAHQGATTPRGDGGATPVSLKAQIALLPTPRASDGKNGGPNQGIASGDIALSSAVIGERFGRYAAAVERWAQVCGVAPPEPTEVGPRSGLRLAPAFPAWMMGLGMGLFGPAPDVAVNARAYNAWRRDVLRMVGNGVMPAQGTAALRLLLDDTSPVS